MSTAVHVIWWISLGLALVATGFAAIVLLQVVKLCRDILELAQHTAGAAKGIARNTAAIAGLSAIIDFAPTLLSVAIGVNGHAETIGTTLESVAPKGDA